MSAVTDDDRSLVGLMFLTPDSSEGGWPLADLQGHFLRQLNETTYLVMLHSWADGEPTDALVVSLDRVMQEDWHLYVTEADWQAAGDRCMKYRDEVGL